MAGFFQRIFGKKEGHKEADPDSVIDLLVAQREIALVIGQNVEFESVTSQTFEIISPFFGHSPSFQVIAKNGHGMTAIASYSEGQFRTSEAVRSEEIVNMAFRQGRVISATEGDRLVITAPAGQETVWSIQTSIEGTPEAKSRLISRYMHYMEELSKFIGLAIKTPELYTKATRDVLTKFGNRQYFNDQLKVLFTTSKRYGDDLSLVLIDIDHFKKINDTSGHLAGDYILSEVARIILRQAREHVDQVFRYGGEEIAIILHRTSSNGALGFAERIRKKIEQSIFRFDGQQIKTTVSVGIAHLNGHQDPTSLIQDADRALYKAKESGRNQTIILE